MMSEVTTEHLYNHLTMQFSADQVHCAMLSQPSVCDVAYTVPRSHTFEF